MLSRWINFLLWILDVLCLTWLTIQFAQHLLSIMPEQAAIPIAIVATIGYMFVFSILVILVTQAKPRCDG